MPGIADVQPKQISSLGQPLVTTAAPVVTPSVMTEFVNAFRTGVITANDIADRFSPEAQAKHQLAKELVTPEAVESRKQVQKAITEKARVEHETSLSKDFIDAYTRYNLPLKKADGTPDYTGMAEVGQKYADMERTLKYSELGLKGTPVQSLDAHGKQITRFINAFGEDITEVPGKVNPALKEYQNMARKARGFLLQNDNEPEVPEGGTPPVIEVTPKQAVAAAAAAAPAIEPTDPFSPESTGVFPQLMPGTPSGLFQPATPPPAGPKITIEPTAGGAPKVVIDSASPSVVPKTAAPESAVYGGEGLVTGRGDFDPDKYVSDVRGSGLYKNWEEKSPFIGELRGIVKKYESLPPGSITTQNDIALATTALMLATPGASAGGRGMEGMRITKLEEAQPLLEQLYGIKGHLLKEHKFEEGTRKRIIEAAERKAQIFEEQGRSAVKSAEERLKLKGYNPTEFLFGSEQQLLSSVAPGTVEGQVGARVNTIRLPSGRVVIGRASTLR